MASVSALQTVAIFSIALECLSTGSEPRISNACTHPKLTIVSQTVEGSGVMVMHQGAAKYGNTSVPEVDTTVEQKIYQSFGIEHFNMVQHVEQDVAMKKFNMTLHQDIDMIMNWNEGLVTTHTKMNGKSSCTTIQLPTVIRLLPIPQISKKLMDLMSNLYKCVGNENGLDKFEFKLDFPPKIIPSPLPLDLNMQFDLEVDEAGLYKSMKMTEVQKLNTKKMQNDVKIDQTLTFTKSKLGGPSAEDLEVPKDWNCGRVCMPDLEELLSEWMGKDSPFFGEARLIPHMLKAMLSESKSSADGAEPAAPPVVEMAPIAVAVEEVAVEDPVRPCHFILNGYYGPVCDEVNRAGSCEAIEYKPLSCTASGWPVCCVGTENAIYRYWYKAGQKCSDLHPDGVAPWTPCEGEPPAWYLV